MPRRIALIATLVALAGAAAAVLLAPDSVLAPAWRYALASVLALPVALAAHMLLEGVAEAALTGVAILIFKVVTLGLVRTEYSSSLATYPWYGVARDREGYLVASAGLVATVALAVSAATAWLVLSNLDFLAAWLWLKAK